MASVDSSDEGILGCVSIPELVQVSMDAPYCVSDFEGAWGGHPLANLHKWVFVRAKILRFAQGDNRKLSCLMSLPFGCTIWMPYWVVSKRHETSNPKVGDTVSLSISRTRLESLEQESPVPESDEDACWERHGINFCRIDQKVFPGRSAAVTYLMNKGLKVSEAYEYLAKVHV